MREVISFPYFVIDRQSNYLKKKQINVTDHDNEVEPNSILLIGVIRISFIKLINDGN